MEQIKIKTKKGSKAIGGRNPVFIVAEMSGNHNQSFDRALKIIDEAARSGADAVKIQTYTADTLTIDSNKKWFQVMVNKAWKGQTLYSLYKKAYTPWPWQPKLKKYAESRGLVLFSTPFDSTAVDFLEKMRVPMYKIASFEIIDIPLLEKVGSTRKPVIMSSGMASISEIKLAVKTLRRYGCPQIALLHCISAYPAKPEEMNLATIPDLARRFKVISGLSDHTLGISTAIASVIFGARIIEKHFTLSRSEGGPDAGFSLEPSEFSTMAKSVREAETAIGQPRYSIHGAESENVIFRKSLFSVKKIKKGEIFNNENVRSIRPGFGLPPKFFRRVLGRKSGCDIEPATPLNWKLIKGGRR